MMPSDFTNEQLLDELSRRLNADFQRELNRMDDEIHLLSARLREAESGKSQFLSNVRNEINNPLTSIIGLAASISAMTSETKLSRMSALIHKQARELEFQMRNIITAAEIEMGEVRMCISKVNVMTLVENAISYFRNKTGERGVTVSLKCEEHLSFRTDAHILETIFINLLSNAIDFTGTNRLVVIETVNEGGVLNISVRDSGNGIGEEIQNSLFQRFSQGERGPRKTHGGHGLGLCVVRELVSFLDGSIELQSSPKEGTNIAVRIPEASATAEVENASSFGNELLFTVDAQF